DLETIVLKALAKEPGQRYRGAEAMADDLRRFVDDRPILARRVSPTEQVWRWCRRNPAVASLMALMAVLMVAGTIGSAVAANHFRNLARSESQARQRAADLSWKQTRATMLADSWLLWLFSQPLG